MKRIAFVLMCALSSLAVAKDDKPLPKDLPPYGADKPLPVAEIAQRTLKNGLTVWVVPRDGLPKINVVLAARGGLAADGPGRDGVSSLLAGLVNEGTTTRTSRQIAEELQGIGGSIGAGASLDGITVYGDALLSKSDTLLELLADVARNAAFPQDEVELAKANALQGLKASESTPGFLAERALTATLFDGHPYARTSQTEASIGAATAESLRATHRARFRPERSLLVIAGRIEPRKGFGWAEKHFGSWKGQGTPPADTPPVDAAPRPKFVLVERPGSVQSSLRIGRPAVAATHEDAIPLALTNTIVSGGFTSRITQNIREDKGYTYSPGGSVRRARAGGALIAQAEVRNEVTGATLNEMLYEFDRLGTTDVGDDELMRAKRYFAGLYLYSNQVQGSVAATLASNWLVGLPAEHLGTYVAKAQAVTPAQVREMGRKYFASRDQSIVVVGDRAAIEKDLAQYGAFATYAH
jgi:zinc protease